MTYLNRKGEGESLVLHRQLFTLTLHPKFLLNPISIYSLLLGEGVKGRNRESKSLKKDDLFIFRKFGNFVFYPLPSPSPLHSAFQTAITWLLGMPYRKIKEYQE
jgi:hypothetical protein